MKEMPLQLTIRGVDHATKAALLKQAAGAGVSLNRFALQVLRRGAGTDTAESRYLALREFAKAHPMDSQDKQAFDDALSWADAASIEKQKRDERAG